MDKFNLDYFINIQTIDGDYLELRYPLTMKFSVERGLMGTTSNARFSIYNLAQNTYQRIQKNYIDGRPRFITVFAGYSSKSGDKLPLIFSGNVHLCQTQRQGVDVVTTIECIEGLSGYTQAFISQSITKGQTRQSVIELLIKELEKTGLKRGSIAQYDGVVSRDTTLQGRPYDLLGEWTNFSCSIDNSQIICVKDNQGTRGDITLISGETGLLNSPVLMNNYVELETLFEPRIRPANIVGVISESRTDINGEYRVNSISHSGTISGAVSSSVVTRISCNKGLFDYVV